MDLSYQAIPHTGPALERARQDAAFCCELEFWSAYAAPSPQRDAMLQAARASGQEHDRAFVDAVALARQAAREHPGLESRRFHWSGRGYDAVHYLLSPARRAGRDDAQDWAHEAIYGTQVLHPGAVTTIGFAIRYLSPEEVQISAEILSAITRNDLLQHFDAEKMKRAGVYKYLGESDGFENWMWPQFEAWRDFYQKMLGFPGEGLICCVG